MTFQSLRNANVERCNKHLHSIEDWTPADWSNAMAGEVGEACNITKKMMRLEGVANGTFKNQMNKSSDLNINNLKDELADELADVIIYADLLAARMGLSLEAAIIKKFNETSEKHEERNNLSFGVLPRLT